MKLTDKVVRQILSSSTSSQEVGIRSLTKPNRGAQFQTKLENYIASEKKGNVDYNSISVQGALAEKLSSSSEFLAKNDPKLLRQYSAYVSSLSWDQRSRFVSNVDDSLDATKKLLDII